LRRIREAEVYPNPCLFKPYYIVLLAHGDRHINGGYNGRDETIHTISNTIESEVLRKEQ
jgi:hypothetical protein